MGQWAVPRDRWRDEFRAGRPFSPVTPPLVPAWMPRLGVALAKRRNGIGMQPGQLGLDRVYRADAAEDSAQPFAEILWVRQGQRRPGNDLPLAVGAEGRNVDAVQ